MGEQTMRRFAAELSVRVEDLIASARMRFGLLAALALVEVSVLGWLVDWGLRDVEGLGIVAVIGGVGGLLALLVILDWGRKLDHRPRAMNLIKARNGAVVLFGLLPFGPLLAWPLLKILRHSTLVGYAVANHPDASRLEGEEVLAAVRVRSAYITLRRFGFALLLIAGGVVVVGLAFSGAGAGEPVSWFIAGGVTGVIAVLAIVVGFIGVVLLQELSRERVEKVRKAARLVWPLFPFGTYAAWAANQVVFSDDDAAIQSVSTGDTGSAPPKNGATTGTE